MTEKLKTLMDRAAEVDFDVVDLAAIVESGDRTVRRRRLRILGGAAALVLVVGTVAFAVGRGDRADDRTPVVDSRAPEVSWIIGDTLHTPTASYDLGRKASVYTRTVAGYAFADDDGHVFSLVDGDVKRIGGGAAGESPLVGDETGSLVGWVDRSGAVPAFVTVDLATGDVRRHGEHLDSGMSGGEPPHLAWFFAIDHGTAYWIDLRGAVATDLATGESTVLAQPDDVQWIGDVTDGLQARLVEDRGGSDRGSDLVTTDGTVVLPVIEDRYFGAVSGDGRWVTTDAGSVVEVRTGKAFPLGVSDVRNAVGYEWLDADTVVVLQEGSGDGIDLLACTVPAGDCTVAVQDLPEGVILPHGLMR